MDRPVFYALLLSLAGCARQKVPTPIVEAPTATPLPTATPIIVQVPAMPVQPAPTSDPRDTARRAIVMRELTRLRAASPEQDFERAWANEDTRFIGVYGFSVSLPGVPKERIRAAIMSSKVSAIEGTNDFIQFPEQEELNSLATRYALRYNRLLLAKFRGTSGPTTEKLTTKEHKETQRRAKSAT